MVLKAVLFDFNGVIIDDEPIHEQLIEQILLDENLRFNRRDFQKYCLGRGDRQCIAELLTSRGRIVGDSYLNGLLQRKALAYQQTIDTLTLLPIYPNLGKLIAQMRAERLKLAVVSGALRSEIELVLDRAQLSPYFSLVVAGDDIKTGKPEPDGYLLAVDRLNQLYPDLQLQPTECLAIEDTFAGIEAAKRAGIKVVGIAHTYPFHMLQRLSNWAIDRFSDLELDRVQRVFAGRERDDSTELKLQN
jgi:beta-phosphoglucomutase